MKKTSSNKNVTMIDIKPLAIYSQINFGKVTKFQCQFFIK